MTTIDNTKTVTTYLVQNDTNTVKRQGAWSYELLLSLAQHVISVTYKYSATLIIFIKLKMA